MRDPGAGLVSAPTDTSGWSVATVPPTPSPPLRKPQQRSTNGVQTMRSIMSRNASADDDLDRFILTVKRIREWGGIRRHGDLDKLGSGAFAVLSDNARRLNPVLGDTDDLSSFRHMGSGYSKVYAMMVPSLPIYE